MREACRWLDEIEPGLGDKLIAELNRVVTAISEYPGMYEQVHRDCRRAVLRTFDYALMYRTRGELVEVLGLMHCRLDPTVAAARSAPGI